MMAKLLRFIRSIPYSLCFSISGYIFIAAFIISLIAFFVFDAWYPETAFAMHVSWLFLLIGFYQKDRDWFSTNGFIKDSKTIIEDAKTLASILSMAGLLNLLGVFDNVSLVNSNIFTLAMVILYAGYILLCSGFALSLLFRLMKQRPHAQLKRISLYIYVLAGIMLIMQMTLPIDEPIIMHILSTFTALLAFYNTRGISWFKGISRKQKRDLALSMFVISISIVPIAIRYNSSTMQALNITTFHVEPLIATIGMWLLLIASRLTILSLYSLPTAGLLDRKSLEFSTLAQLTSNAIHSEGIDAIISDTMELLPKSIQLEGMYCRIHAFNVDHIRFSGRLGAELSLLLNSAFFADWISSLNEPETLYELPTTANPQSLFFSQSILAMPLKKNGNVFGEILLSHTQSYHFTPEDEAILQAFGESINIATEHMALISISKEHDRLENEMIIAKSVHQSLLPKTIIQPSGYAIKCCSLSAREVGGDFYDVFRMANGNTCIIIADVSGKGIPAAFLMATLRGTILSLHSSNFGAKEILTEIQLNLSSILEPHMFITASCLIIEESKGTAQFARAGHMPLIHLKSGVLTEYKPQGIGIGLTKDIDVFSDHLQELHLQLSIGEMCLLFTDGLTEMLDMQQNSEQLFKMHDPDPEHIIDSVMSSVSALPNDVIRDDITIIAIKKTKDVLFE
jgi:serine phosphatase RsbU (regulator of sigma subunit)